MRAGPRAGWDSPPGLGVPDLRDGLRRLRRRCRSAGCGLAARAEAGAARYPAVGAAGPRPRLHPRLTGDETAIAPQYQMLLSVPERVTPPGRGALVVAEERRHLAAVVRGGREFGGLGEVHSRRGRAGEGGRVGVVEDDPAEDGVAGQVPAGAAAAGGEAAVGPGSGGDAELKLPHTDAGNPGIPPEISATVQIVSAPPVADVVETVTDVSPPRRENKQKTCSVGPVPPEFSENDEARPPDTEPVTVTDGRAALPQVDTNA